MREAAEETAAPNSGPGHSRRLAGSARMREGHGAAIWQWAFIERVSTGLFKLQLEIDDAHEQLAVAERIVTDGIGRPRHHHR